MALQQHMVLQMLEDGPPSTTASYATSSRPSCSVLATSSLPSGAGGALPSVASPDAAPPPSSTRLSRSRFALLALQSLGIVFGDIGTSPLYVMRAVFSTAPAHTEDIVGACSAIIWSLLLLGLVLATFLFLSAPHNGEGGVFALGGALLSPSTRLSKRVKRMVAVLCVLGGALLIADGAFTPSVSILGAVQGLSLASARLTSAVMPIALVIAGLIFALQPFGSSRVGNVFGPVMLLWFVTVFAIGIWRVASHPSALRAFNPWLALQFLTSSGWHSYSRLAPIFLSVTGFEAISHDLGHFTAGPLRAAFVVVVLPSLIANYLGQTAHLLQHPADVSDPFYLTAPRWAYWPMLVLSTASAVIASQAIITACFAIASQAISLGFAPPMTVRRTSRHLAHQTYVPAVNVLLMLLTVAFIAGFGTTQHGLTHAYSLTVCSLALVMVLLYAMLVWCVWRAPLSALLAGSLFGCLVLLFAVPIAHHVPHGAWVAVLVTCVFSLLLFAWWFGEKQLRRYLKHHGATTSIDRLAQRLHAKSAPHAHDRSPSSEVSSLHAPASDAALTPGTLMELDVTADNSVEVVRSRGLAIFLADKLLQTSPSFECYVERSHSLPQYVVFAVPRRSEYASEIRGERCEVIDHGGRIFSLVLSVGFAEPPLALLDLLPLLPALGAAASVPRADVTVFVSSVLVEVLPGSGLVRRTLLSIYAELKSAFPDASRPVALPPANTITVGHLCPLS